MEKAYTVATLAEALNVSPHTVRKVVKNGTCPVPVVKLGTAIRFPAGPVEKLLAGELGEAPKQRRVGRPSKAEQVAAQRAAGATP